MTALLMIGCFTIVPCCCWRRNLFPYIQADRLWTLASCLYTSPLGYSVRFLNNSTSAFYWTEREMMKRHRFQDNIIMPSCCC